MRMATPRGALIKLSETFGAALCWELGLINGAKTLAIVLTFLICNTGLAQIKG